MTYANGDSYEGKFKYNVRTGKGELTTKTMIYKGEFKNDLKNGRGSE